MKSLLILLTFLGVVASKLSYADDKIEVCKSISQITDFYACDVGAGVFFISKYPHSFMPKPAASPTPAETKKK